MPVSRGTTRRPPASEIQDALRDLRLQLAALHHQVSGLAGIRDADLDCLEVVDRYGPLSPSTLARRTGLHPATVTGVLDRLEGSGLVVRERDRADRRSVVIRGQPTRAAEVFGGYAGLAAAVEQICAGYREPELELICEFLRRTAVAGMAAAAELVDSSG
jgi:DNA-binding MarR family transcriptional regulator